MEPATALDQVVERHARVAQAARVGEHVVLLLEAAEADHVGDAGRAHQVLRDDPVLPAPQLAGRVAIALQRVLVDLPDGRVVGAEARRDPVGHVGVGQPFGHLLARPVDVDVVLEGQDHLRQTERRDRPLDQHARRAGQRPLERDGDALLDLLRGLAGEEGDDHDLDVGDVGERLDLQVAERQRRRRSRTRARRSGWPRACGPRSRSVGRAFALSTRPGGACHAAGLRKVRARRRRGSRRFRAVSAGAKCPSGLIAPSILPDARHSSSRTP